jgi:RNA polymerase sigma factor (sigma-70 family)
MPKERPDFDKILSNKHIKKEFKLNALSDVYNCYRNEIYGFVIKKTNSDDEAEKLLSDIFLRFCEFIIKKEGIIEYSSRALLYSIARSLICNWIKDKKRISRIRVLSDLLIMKLPSSQKGPDDETIGKEEQLAVIAEVNNLSEKIREVIILWFYDGLSAPEITSILKINQRFVYDLLEKGVRQLKRRIKYRKT